MKEKVLISLPIYSCTEKTLEKDYKKYLRRKASYAIQIYADYNKTEEEAIKEIERFYWKKRIWKYNQIIGYLQVLVFGNSLAFNRYLPEEKNVMRFSNKKKFVCMMHVSGMYVQLTGTNEEIANRLLKAIRDIAKMNKWIIDTSEFELFYKDINYLKLRDYIKKVSYL